MAHIAGQSLHSYIMNLAFQHDLSYCYIRRLDDAESPPVDWRNITCPYVLETAQCP